MRMRGLTQWTTRKTRIDRATTPVNKLWRNEAPVSLCLERQVRQLTLERYDITGIFMDCGARELHKVNPTRERVQ